MPQRAAAGSSALCLACLRMNMRDAGARRSSHRGVQGKALSCRAALFHATISWRLIDPFTAAPVAVAGVLAAISIALLLTTALMDPGFIPRQPEDIEQG